MIQPLLCSFSDLRPTTPPPHHHHHQFLSPSLHPPHHSITRHETTTICIYTIYIQRSVWSGAPSIVCSGFIHKHASAAVPNNPIARVNVSDVCVCETTDELKKNDVSMCCILTLV